MAVCSWEGRARTGRCSGGINTRLCARSTTVTSSGAVLKKKSSGNAPCPYRRNIPGHHAVSIIQKKYNSVMSFPYRRNTAAPLYRRKKKLVINKVCTGEIGLQHYSLYYTNRAVSLCFAGLLILISTERTVQCCFLNYLKPKT